jgi:hypothetical protein
VGIGYGQVILAREGVEVRKPRGRWSSVVLDLSE